MRYHFWTDEPEFWFRELQSSEKGISTDYAEKLLKSGKKFKKTSRTAKELKLLVSQFKNPLMLLLIGAVVISAFLGEISDVGIISCIIISTTTLSFIQERNAGRVVEKLQALITLKCNVLRENIDTEIESHTIVPGDVLLLNAGDIVPADCLLFEANELHTSEASLTGETFPVRKEVGKVTEQTPITKRTNCVWQGSNIISGTGKALVIYTGNDTVFGKMAKSLEENPETTFEKGIKQFGFFLMKITLVLSIFILLVNLYFGRPVLESALFALALAVGMAPELLPAITTIAMSAGARRMLEQKVIVKKLSSIQNLGEIDLLCTDKTGTITQGSIDVKGFLDIEGKDSELVHQLAYLNASMESGYNNPIDQALEKLPVQWDNKPQKLDEIPYDFFRKRLSILARLNEENILVSKGAFTNILQVCTLVRIGEKVKEIAPYIEKISHQYDEYGAQGFRVIGLSYKKIQAENCTKENEADMIFVGFILLQDPIKEGIKSALDKLRELHIGTKIITGDNRNVAKSIALQIGISYPKVLCGEDIDNMTADALAHKVKETHIFAEVEPRQKEIIIRALQKWHTVAYMGDGINDVAAINAADVGISVDNAVDVAREAADIVLMEKNLTVLAEGIVQGRKTFQNTLKYIFINTGATFGNMFSMAGASLFLPFLPMLPKQILLTNFLTDFPYLSIASDNVDKERLAKPGKWDLKMIRNYMTIFGIHSSVFDLITFLTLLFLLKVNESTFQTGWFVESVLTEFFILFIVRTHKYFFTSKPSKYLLILSTIGLLATLALPYLPETSRLGFVKLDGTTMGCILTIVFFYVVTGDFLKKWFFRKYSNA
jgi:Mg2+-importing ATPase